MPTERESVCVCVMFVYAGYEMGRKMFEFMRPKSPSLSRLDIHVRSYRSALCFVLQASDP